MPAQDKVVAGDAAGFDLLNSYDVAMGCLAPNVIVVFFFVLACAAALGPCSYRL